MIEIVTERLIIRPPELSDVDALVKVINDERVAKTTLNLPYPYSEEDAVNWISNQKPLDENPESVQLNIFLKDTGQLIGGCGLSSINRRHSRAELGYWCGFDYWNNGYTTEAANAVVKYGFAKLGLHRIYAIHFDYNPASGRVMEKIGMRYEGTLRDCDRKDGEFITLKMYAILSTDLE